MASNDHDHLDPIRIRRHACDTPRQRDLLLCFHFVDDVVARDRIDVDLHIAGIRHDGVHYIVLAGADFRLVTCRIREGDRHLKRVVRIRHQRRARHVHTPASIHQSGRVRHAINRDSDQCMDRIGWRASEAPRQSHRIGTFDFVDDVVTCNRINVDQHIAGIRRNDVHAVVLA